MYSKKLEKMSLKDICILYIDDDQDTIDIILDDLKSCVHKISLAQTQGEALEKFKSEKFDLIIISINLRKEDGFKVLTHLRKVEPDIRHCFNGRLYQRICKRNE